MLYIYTGVHIYLYILLFCITQTKAFLTEFEKAGLGAAKQGLAAAKQAWADRPGRSKAVPGRSKTGLSGSRFCENSAKQGLGAARPGILMKEPQKRSGQKCVWTASACADRPFLRSYGYCRKSAGNYIRSGGKMCCVCWMCWVVRECVNQSKNV